MQVITFIGVLLYTVFNRVFEDHMDNNFLSTILTEKN